MEEPSGRVSSRRVATAYHEGGHVVAAHFRPFAPRTDRVTLRRGERSPGAAGTCFGRRALSPVHAGGLSVDREALAHNVIYMLGGHAADLIRTGPDHLTSAGRDFTSARRLLWEADGWRYLDAAARRMGLPDPAAAAADGGLAREMAELSVQALFDHLDAATAEAVELLEEKWHAVEAVARRLIRRGTLSGAEVADLIEQAEAEARR